MSKRRPAVDHSQDVVRSFAEARPRGPLMTDPDMPCCTTKDGRNPWPAIWFERAQEGEGVPHEWQDAVEAERVRRGGKPAIY